MTTYGYDAEGNRIRVTDAAGATTYTVDPNTALPRVLVRTKPSGARTFYVYGPVLLYEVDEASGAARHYHYDQIGSTVALTNDAGVVTGRQAYSAYGVPLAFIGAMDTPFRWVGAFGVQTDANGLLHMRARYYHPSLGRFVSQDPLGLAAGPNVYAYCGGNPVGNVDPSGLVENIKVVYYNGDGDRKELNFEYSSEKNFLATMSVVPDRSVHYFQIGGHGSPKSIDLGTAYNSPYLYYNNLPNTTPGIYFSDGTGRAFMSTMRRVLDNSSIVSFDGCNTACYFEQDNIASGFARLMANEDRLIMSRGYGFYALSNYFDIRGKFDFMVNYVAPSGYINRMLGGRDFDSSRSGLHSPPSRFKSFGPTRVWSNYQFKRACSK